MRIEYKFLFFFILLLSISSCSNDFDLVEKGSEIPVVYGVISAQDSANYVRVEKAFIDENIGGDILAKDPSNLYFDDINVKLRHVSSGKEYELRKVDGNLEGYKRTEGAFASAPNYLYKIKRSEINLVPKEEYKLVVSRNDGNILTEATTKMLTPLTDSKGDVQPLTSSLLNFGYNTDFKISWFAYDNSVIHDVILIINYTESLNGVTLEKSVNWKIAVNFVEKSTQTNSYSLSYQGRNFYDFLAGALTPSSQTNPVKRVFKDISIKILSGGQPIKDLIKIGQANLGITSSGEIPVFSNMSNGARGIFSSKSEFLRHGMGINKITLDSLRNGIITKPLNFQ